MLGCTGIGANDARNGRRAADVLYDLLMSAHCQEGYFIYPSPVKHFGSFSTLSPGRFSTMERHDRLRAARIAAGYERQRDVFEHHPDWKKNSYKSNENGNAPFSFEAAKGYAKAFGVRAEWLYDGNGPMKAGRPDMVPIIGRVGADNEGTVFLSDGQAAPDFAPLPPFGSERAVAVDVVGHSMKGIADQGALIYFEDQRTPPTPDMLGQIVVLETEDGRVLVKRLLRGSEKGVWDLESMSGPMLTDVRIRWAAHISAIIPPFMARRLAKRAGEAA